MKPGVVAVIVTYNRADKLVHAYGSIAAQDVLKIIVVNNASTDGTRVWLDSLDDDRLQVLHLDRNIGGAGGFNRGFELAAQVEGGEWLLCFDDDAYAHAELIERFAAMQLDEDVGGVACAVYHTDGSVSEMNRPSYNPFGTFTQAMRTVFIGGKGFHIDDACFTARNPHEIDCSSFVGLFVRLSLVRDVNGLPDSKLFLYGDDILYTWSIREAGFRHLFAPRLEFVHDCESVAGGVKRYSPLWKVYYTYRNGLVLYRKFAGRLFPFILVAKCLSWSLAMRHYGSGERLRYLKYARMAVFDYFRDRYDRSHEEVVSSGES